MKTKMISMPVSLIIAALFLSACGGSAAATGTPEAIPTVIADGRINGYHLAWAE